MPFSDLLRATLLADLSEVHRELQAARGLFRVQLEDEVYELPISGYDWQPVPGMEGLELRPLRPEEWPVDAPLDTDFFHSRGPQGARQPRLRMGSAIRIHIRRGSLLYWKESQPAYTLYEAGDTLEMAANEEYGFVAREDFENLVAFTPRITTP